MYPVISIKKEEADESFPSRARSAQNYVMKRVCGNNSSIHVERRVHFPVETVEQTNSFRNADVHLARHPS